MRPLFAGLRRGLLPLAACLAIGTGLTACQSPDHKAAMPAPTPPSDQPAQSDQFGGPAMPIAPITPLDLQALIDATIARGEHTVTLEPGRYRVPTTVAVSGQEHFTLDGQGATLLMPSRGELLSFAGVQNVTVKNLTVDCDPLPFTQGTITAINDAFTVFDYEIHPGYPTIDNFAPQNGRSGIFVFDPGTRQWRQDVPDLYSKNSEMLTPTTGRFSFPAAMAGYRNIRVGDYVAFKNIYGNAFLFQGCGNVSLTDVTVQASPCAGFLLRACSGKVRLTRCTIKRGPKPEGATHERLLSTNADGFNLAYSRHGVEMEGCDFSYMGDDSVNLHGTFMDIVAVESSQSFLVARAWSDEPFRQIRAGDQLRVLDAKSFGLLAEAKATQVVTVPPTPELEAELRERWKLPNNAKLYCYRFTTDRPLTVAAGNKLEVPAIACPNFVFRDNYFHDHRARGLRLGASHGLIENNRFERIKSSAITLGPHAIHGEGGWVRDVTVAANRFNDVCTDERGFAGGSYNAGAIVVQHFVHDPTTPYVQENADIRIVFNRIDRVGGAAILGISVDGLEIRENVISRTQLLDCDEVGGKIRLVSNAAISINHSRNVVVGDNEFGELGPFCRGEYAERPAVGEGQVNTTVPGESQGEVAK